MIYVFYFFAVVLVVLGWKSLRGGIDYLDFFKREIARPQSEYTPFCSIIAPCRGLDEGLSENLAALFAQDFPAYEIVFVVGDRRDAAVQIIENLMAEKSESAVLTKLVFAGEAVNESQKVYNLRRAVLKVAVQSEAFVFVDSDARPGKDWLRDLIAPLADENVGCTTGYRWFISKRASFASELRSVWNASVASALGANSKNNFCWGGSLAMRRQTFEKLSVSENWRGTLSDDFTVTRLMRRAKLPIYFVPQCLTATVESCDFSEMLEFTTRQMKITRVCAAHLWKAALISSFIFSTIFWTGVALLFVASGRHFWLTLAFVALIFALGAIKAALRLRAVKLVLKDYEKDLNRQFLPHLFLWTLAQPIFFYNCACALLSNKIVWRGIEYELKSATETRVLTTNRASN